MQGPETEKCARNVRIAMFVNWRGRNDYCDAQERCRSAVRFVAAGGRSRGANPKSVNDQPSPRAYEKSIKVRGIGK